ncbi:MAG: hypothetical protein P8J59_04680 [Phycisphaerales bacterium]|nr:hypothetical protein [Phycisphaerales bacterium]
MQPPDRFLLLRRSGLAGFVVLLLLVPIAVELIAQEHNEPLHGTLEALTRASLDQCDVDDRAMESLIASLDPAILDADDPDRPRLWIEYGDGRLAFDRAVLQETLDRFHPDLSASQLDATTELVKIHVTATNEKQRIREAFSSTRSRMRPVWWGRPIPKDWS